MDWIGDHKHHHCICYRGFGLGTSGGTEQGRKEGVFSRDISASKILRCSPMSADPDGVTESIPRSPAAGGVSLLALAPQVVGERELEQGGEDEGRAGAHPDVDRLRRHGRTGGRKEEGGRERGREGGREREKDETSFSKSNAADSIWHAWSEGERGETDRQTERELVTCSPSPARWRMYRQTTFVCQ